MPHALNEVTPPEQSEPELFASSPAARPSMAPAGSSTGVAPASAAVKPQRPIGKWVLAFAALFVVCPMLVSFAMTWLDAPRIPHELSAKELTLTLPRDRELATFDATLAPHLRFIESRAGQQQSYKTSDVSIHVEYSDACPPAATKRFTLVPIREIEQPGTPQATPRLFVKVLAAVDNDARCRPSLRVESGAASVGSLSVSSDPVPKTGARLALADPAKLLNQLELASISGSLMLPVASSPPSVLSEQGHAETTFSLSASSLRALSIRLALTEDGLPMFKATLASTGDAVSSAYSGTTDILAQWRFNRFRELYLQVFPITSTIVTAIFMLLELLRRC